MSCWTQGACWVVTVAARFLLCWRRLTVLLTSASSATPAATLQASVCHLKPAWKVQLKCSFHFPSIWNVHLVHAIPRTLRVVTGEKCLESATEARTSASAFAAACGGELNAPSGTISSPNYPNLYPHSRVCRWEIVVPAGRRVTLTINDLRLEDTAGCYYDFVEVNRPDTCNI